MSVRVLPFRSDTTERNADRPAPGFTHTSIRFLNRLRDTLSASAQLISACRLMETKRKNRWVVPSLFFFDRDAQAVWSAERPAGPKFPEPFLSEVASRMPVETAAWQRLPSVLDDALTLLPASIEVRRAARATSGLCEAAKVLAPLLKPANELAELLAVPDDQVFLVIHPEARIGMRILARGVADVNQLHTLLADELIGNRVLRGSRPDPRIVSAYLDTDADPDANMMTARFQLFRPDALNTDGTLPTGFSGSDHWVWGEESPTSFPLEKGERVVLLSDAVYPATWEVGRKFPRLSADIQPIEMLSRTNVERWLTVRCPNLSRVTAVRQAA